jgi:hypothetical protein
MKKITLILVAIIFSTIVSLAQTTAIDFTLTDCDGISHTLFPIIDSGNAVVLVYEHQCGSCVAGVGNLKSAINTNFSTTPNIRVLYLDNGGYSCSSVKTWISSHSYIPGPAFTYASDQSTPYGPGMPVIVVAGTKSHKVYIVANNSGPATYTNVTNLKNAIQSALTDISNGINSEQGNNSSVSIYPNPADNNKTWLHFNNSLSKVSGFEIVNAAGQIIQPLTIIQPGVQDKEISTSRLEKGIYFIYLNSSEGTIVKKLIVSR